MSNKETHFSIDLHINNPDDPLVQAFLGQFTEAMASGKPLNGLIEVMGCGWHPTAGSMTQADAYESFLRDLGENPEMVLKEYLEDSDLGHYL